MSRCLRKFREMLLSRREEICLWLEHTSSQLGEGEASGTGSRMDAQMGEGPWRQNGEGLLCSDGQLGTESFRKISILFLDGFPNQRQSRFPHTSIAQSCKVFFPYSECFQP